MPEPGLSPRARVMLPACLILLLLLSYWRLSVDEPVLVQWTGATMGTTYQVKLVAPGLDADARADLTAAGEARLERVDALMSNWRPDSELSRFNARTEPEPARLDPQTLGVLALAEEVSRASGGGFDVTVAPLVRAWGFGADAAGTPPAPGELAALRERVGHGLLEIDRERGTVRKLRPDVEVDLSAIAKGHGVDELARLLLERGHRDFLVEIGGELRAHGLRPDGTPWRVAIEQPDARDRAIHRVIPLRDRAMATSGDYRNYYERDGRRISHTIDPRTGRPIEHGLASVTVVAPEAVVADAWATALQVLGPRDGPELARSRGLAVWFIAREDDGFRAFGTDAFAALVPADASED